jgi:hypothetical protein
VANEVNIKVTADSKNAVRSLDRVSASGQKLGSSMRSVGKSMAVGVAGIAAVTAAAGVAASKMFSLAGELDLIENKVSTVFGEQRGLVTDWAKEVSAEMGLTVSQTENLAAKFGDLLVPMGFTREAAAGMSTSVVGLSGALAEWSSGQVDASQAADILAKAMLGEREGLKTLGISIMEADVQARLLAQGQDELTGKALQQAKAMITQTLIFEKSQDAQAAFAKGGDTLARTQAKLKAATGELKESIVKALMPSFANLAVTLNKKVIPLLIDKLIPFLSEKIPEAIAFVSPFVKNFAEGFMVAFDFVSKLVKKFVDFFQNSSKTMKTIITALGAALLIVFAPGAAVVVGIVAMITLIGKLKNSWREVVNAILESVEKMANGLLSGLSKALSVVDSFVNKVIDGVNSIRIAGRQLFNIAPVAFAGMAPQKISLGRVGVKTVATSMGDLEEGMTSSAIDAAFPAASSQSAASSFAMPTLTALPKFTAKGGKPGEQALPSGLMMSDLMEWSRTRMESIRIQESNIRQARTSAIAAVLSGNLSTALQTFGAGGEFADQNIMEDLLDLAEAQSIEDQQRASRNVMSSPIVVNLYAGVLGDPAEAGQLILDQINRAKMAGASTAFLTEN